MLIKQMRTPPSLPDTRPISVQADTERDRQPDRQHRIRYRATWIMYGNLLNQCCGYLFLTNQQHFQPKSWWTTTLLKKSINKWHVGLLFHSEPHMKGEERQTERKKKEETFSLQFVSNFKCEFDFCLYEVWLQCLTKMALQTAKCFNSFDTFT